MPVSGSCSPISAVFGYCKGFDREGGRLSLCNMFKFLKGGKPSLRAKSKTNAGGSSVGGIMQKSMGQPHGRRSNKSPHGWLKHGNTPCDIRSLPKCRARSKSTGVRCGNIAMRGKRVCHLHGGKSPGAPRGNKNALKHGHYSSAGIIERKSVRSITKQILATISEIKKMAE